MAEASGIDPAFQQQLEQLFAHAPHSIAVRSGFRSHEEQQALHDRANQDHPGEADKWAAQPGTSWHEFGYAADLSFADSATLQWAHEHAADYGLFFPMAWEPWHIQPLWTQGRKPSAASPPTGGTTIPPDNLPPEQQQVNVDPLSRIFGTFRSTLHSPVGLDSAHPFHDDTMTIGQRWYTALHPVTQEQAQAQGGLGGGLAVLAGGDIHPVSGGDSWNYQKVYQLLLKHGATPEQARIMAALPATEANGYDPRAYNGNAATGDKSYGLFQINMLGNMGEQRMKDWGLSSYDDLFDPDTNAAAAVALVNSQGLEAWSDYKNGKYKAHMPGTAS